MRSSQNSSTRPQHRPRAGRSRAVGLLVSFAVALGVLAGASSAASAAPVPGFSWISPVAGDTFTPGQTYTIEWAGGDANENVNLSLANVAQWQVVSAGLPQNTANDGAHVWTAPTSLPPGDYLFYIENTARTRWKYGPTFTLSAPAATCGNHTAPAGHNVIKSNAGWISGTNGPDFICAGNRSNLVAGRGGDDIIITRGGRDLVLAGNGNDLVIAGGGNDFVVGGRGHDDLRGSRGNDFIVGSRGDDTLKGNRGDDLLMAAQGADTLKGGAGNDRLLADHGDDHLNGGPGTDYADGGNGTDVCENAESEFNCENPVVDTDGDGLTDDVDPHPTDVDVNGDAGGVLQDWVDVAQPGDTIYATGTFNESVLVLADLDVVGDCSSGTTIVAPAGEHSFFANDGAVVSVDCVVAEGTLDANGDTTYGVGFVAQGGAQLTVTNSTARNQFTGLYSAQAGSVLNASDCLVEDNHRTDGNGQGGGVAVFDKGSAHLTDCTVQRNSATLYGGGLFNKGTLTVTNSTVTDNAASDGAGLFMWNVSGSSYETTITDTTFSGNEASNRGGGVFANLGDGTLTGVTITDNTAGNEGGAVYETHVGMFAISADTLAAIAGNTVPQCVSHSQVLDCDPAVDTDGDGLTDDVDPHPTEVDVDGGAGGVLQDWVDVAQPGDTIWATGTFNESVEINQDLTVNGDCATPTTVIAPPGEHTVEVGSGAVVAINCLIAEGTLDNGAPTSGIAFISWEGADLTLSSVTARNQSVGLYASQAGSGLHATDCVVEDNHNSATQGGGLTAFDNTVVDLTNCTVQRNSSAQYGGGLFAKGALTVTGSTITDNSSVDGAGLFMWNVSGSGHPVTITDSTFSNNTASGRGGAFFANLGQGSLDGVTITGNTAGNGSAVYETHVGQFAISADTYAAMSGNSSPQCVSNSQVLSC